MLRENLIAEVAMGERFITVKQAVERTSLSRVEIYRRMKSGDFPRAVPLGPNRVAFVESEVADWIKNQIDRRGGAS